MKTSIRFAVVSLLLALAIPAFAVDIYILNADGPNEGFNDPTPAAAVGGNTGTTLGQQRQIAFAHAATIWGETLDSVEPIYVVAAFNPLGTNVLGSAGAWDVFSDFVGSGIHPGSEFAATWYNSALADKLAGRDMDNTSPDIIAQFSSNFNFYLGLDNNHGPQNDLVAVLLHELGHGLGFQNFVNESTGANLGGFTDAGRFYPVQTDIYSRHTLDTTNSLYWDQMTQAQRQASAVRFGNVVWDGPHVNAGVPLVLSLGSPEVRVLTPAAIAGSYQFGTGGAFALLPSSPGVSGAVIAAEDAANAAGPATTDGCTAFTNGAAIAGKIALVERGACGFAVKARNAEAAGAIGVMIYNNLANVNGAPPGMASDGGPPVGIVAVSLTRASGLAIVGQLGTGVNASISVDQSIRAGANPQGMARLYMPFPVVGGSSGSHYDSIASRNLLMEPAINADLTHSLAPPEDLTLPLMRDIGWFPDADLDGADDATIDECGDSNLAATVAIQACDSGVVNTLFANGCTISDKIAQCAASAKNHGQFSSCASRYTDSLLGGTLTQAQKDSIQKCVAKSTIGK